MFEKVDLAQRAVDRLARLDRQLKLLEPAPTGHPEKVADHADPFGHAAAALPRLQAAATDAGPKTDDARHLGPAATVIGAFDVALTLLDSAIEGMRFEGRLGDLPRLLALRGMVAARLADWDVAVTSADESHRLADELE